MEEGLAIAFLLSTIYFFDGWADLWGFEEEAAVAAASDAWAPADRSTFTSPIGVARAVAVDIAAEMLLFVRLLVLLVWQLLLHA
jgi:hypothetical protein